MRNLRWTWWNGEIGIRDLSARVGNSREGGCGSRVEGEVRVEYRNGVRIRRAVPGGCRGNRRCDRMEMDLNSLEVGERGSRKGVRGWGNRGVRRGDAAGMVDVGGDLARNGSGGRAEGGG